MRTRMLMGVVFLSMLICSAFALAQSDVEEPAESMTPPKLGISGENITVERHGNVLTLYWSGWIDLVKPSAQPISLSVRCSMNPAGKWRTRPRNRVVPDTFAPGVNSSFHKFDLAELDVPAGGDAGGVPPTMTLLEKEQRVTLKITLRHQKSAEAQSSMEEREYKLNPLAYFLLQAAKSGNVAEVQALLRDGVPPDGANVLGWNALMAACRAGSLDVVKLLVEKNANLVAQTRGFAFSESANGSPIPRGATPLLAAAYAGRPEIVKFLLDSGANYGDYLKRVRRSGATDQQIVSLLQDTGAGQQEVIDQLVRQGAARKDIDALVTRGGFADIVWRVSAKGMMYADIVERLRKTGASDDLIASRLGKKGASSEDIQKAMAARWPTQDAIRQTLLDKGATKEEADALVSERRLGEEAVRACLRDNGAKPEEIETLLRDRSRADDSIRTFLREKGIPAEDAEACLTEKGAPLEQVVTFLTRHGGTVDALRGDRWTPLIAASFSGSPQVVSLLLDEGANPFATDDSGYSALALARVNGHTAAARLLKARGAPLSVPWNPSGEQ